MIPSPPAHAAAFLVAALAAGNPLAAQIPNFAPGFESPGASGGVYALAVFDGGTGPALHAAGEFAAAGTALANGIARWNGLANTWTSLGGGVDGRVGSLLVFDEDGAGPLPPRLFAAGSFTRAGSVAANRIARWNGSSWSALGQGTDDVVTALAVFDDDGPGPRPAALYAAGLFEQAGGIPAAHVARWNGLGWEPLGAGLDAPAMSLAVFDADGPGPGHGELYAGGFFTSAGGMPAQGLARWNGLAWQPAGAGIAGSESAPAVTALSVFDADGPGPQPPRLFVGGSFTTAGGVPSSGVASFDGNAYAPLANGVAAPGSFPSVRALRALDLGAGPRLFAVGRFQSAGATTVAIDALNDDPLLSVASWDGSAWTTLGAGIANNVNGAGRALEAFDHDLDGTPSLFVGGFFSAAGTAPAGGVARWNGAAWQPLGSGRGLDGEVLACAGLALPGSPVFVGGSFTTTGPVRALRVARWNDAGAAWSPLGAGFDDTVRALELHGGALFAGGDFESSGGVSVPHVAQFNGASWMPVGTGTSGRVHALRSFQGQLVAGGAFRAAGAVAASHVAAWNGAAWQPLGAGTDDLVHALAVFDEGAGPRLFAAGEFLRAGGVVASGVARWDGAQWTPVGGGLCCGVHALAVFDAGGGPALYAGGSFEVNGSSRVDGVARWNPLSQTWSAVGTGFQGGRPTVVRALAATQIGGVPALIAGGTFDAASGVPARNLARWDGALWSPVGQGTDGAVHALRSQPVLAGTEALFVGGAFAVIDTRPAARFARGQ